MRLHHDILARNSLTELQNHFRIFRVLAVFLSQLNRYLNHIRRVRTCCQLKLEYLCLTGFKCVNINTLHIATHPTYMFREVNIEPHIFRLAVSRVLHHHL